MNTKPFFSLVGILFVVIGIAYFLWPAFFLQSPTPTHEMLLRIIALYLIGNGVYCWLARHFSYQQLKYALLSISIYFLMSIFLRVYAILFLGIPWTIFALHFLVSLILLIWAFFIYRQHH